MIEYDDDVAVGQTGDFRVGGPAEPGERDRAYLIVLAGSNVGEMFKISKDTTVLGRGQGAEIQILDEGISRKHASLRIEGGVVFIEDAGSRNGIYVNGARVQRHQLRDGDKIQVGSTTILKFTYHDHLDESFSKQMYESALRDGLTKAFNKKYFMDRLESEFRFAKRHGTPLSLVMLDVDHFKQVNDTYGHIAGDHILAGIAKRIQDAIRTEDVFARYGGEEFGVICRAIDALNATALAERLRTTIAASALRYGNAALSVTISLGVAGFPECNVPDALAFLSAADGALYEAKKSGRNRVQVAIWKPPPLPQVG